MFQSKGKGKGAASKVRIADVTASPGEAPIELTELEKAEAKLLVTEGSLAAERAASIRLRSTIRRLQIEKHSEERIREEIYKIAGINPDPPAWLNTPREQGSFGVPMTLWSDWHTGEVVTPEEVGGVNTFNTEICATRAQRLVNEIIDICFNKMSPDAKYPGIVVCLGGDMCSGDIHEELAVTNDRYMLQTIHDLLDILIPAITTLRDKFGNVFLPCVPGNHGRATKKPRAKGRAYTNYEWHLYILLARHFKGDKKVQFYIPVETDAHFTVVNHRFLLTHGDCLGVKGGDGIIGSIGPIMRGSIKVSKAESHIGKNYDTILMGHWHQYIALGGLIVNGSLKGYDEYARLFLRAPFQLPIQAMWFVHPKRGITMNLPIYLEDQLNPVHDDSWIKWNPTIREE